jgi:hypothetical protein
MTGDCHVRFCERLGLKCPCLLDVVINQEPKASVVARVLCVAMLETD